MVGKKKIAVILSGLLMITGLMSCSKTVNEKSEEGNEKTSVVDENNGDVYTIGISQFIQHDALDSAREGFIEGLKEKGFEEGKNIKFDYKNAQGDVSIAKTISDQFVTSKVDMIFAIATPNVQAAYNSTKDIPIVFTAVTDPVETEVAKGWESSETNVTGTSDMVSIDNQLDLLSSLVPDIKTLGVIYCSSEVNSVIQVNSLKDAVKDRDIEIKEVSVTNVSEINQNLSSVLGSIDALYVPTDNTIASAYDLVGNLCINKNIPILCAEEAGVSKGGLCSIGIDYFKLGKEAGYKAAEVLQGTNPSDIAITTMADMDITINTAVAEKLNITIPEDTLEKANKVTGGVN